MTGIDFAYRDFCTERFPRPAAAEVQAFEERIRVPIPDEFREYLLRYNGGRFSGPQIATSDRTVPRTALAWMFGLGATDPATELDLEQGLELNRPNARPQLIPIGCTLQGALILLVTGGGTSDFGNIVLREDDRLHYLAHTIFDFFETLSATS